MSAAYIATGSVRGDCGHRHRTPEAAERCAQRDNDRCERAGGYSDRWPKRLNADGYSAALTDAEQDAVWAVRHAEYAR